MTGAVDTHAHLTDPRLLPRLDAVLARAHEAGVSQIVAVGWDLPSSELVVRLAQGHPCLWASIGVHPHYAAGVTAETMQHLRELARAPRVVAIGETGLDFYRDLAPRETQFDAFRRHLDLAGELGLPAIFHCREAAEPMLEALEVRQHLSLVWHSFDGTPEQTHRAASLGIMMGVSGIVTYPDTPWRRATVAAIPMGHMLLETDAPVLAPYLKDGKRPRDNEPMYVPVIAECVAGVRGESVEAIATATTANARGLFGLNDDCE